MRDDRGATLVEMLVVLMLTTLTASALLAVVTGSANSVVRLSHFDPRVQVATDSLTRDLRNATEVQVVAHDGVTITALDIVMTDGSVRWASDGRSAITRTATDGNQSTVVEGLNATQAVSFELFTRSAQPIAPDDSLAVELCTGRVGIEVRDDANEALHSWSVSLRLFGDERASC